jgi:hypothetical protein
MWTVLPLRSKKPLSSGERFQKLADLSSQNEVGQIIERRRLPVHDHE